MLDGSQPLSASIPEHPAFVLLGDVNLDGIVNLLDVHTFVVLLTESEYLAEGDTNFDGAINLLDVQYFVDILSGI